MNGESSAKLSLAAETQHIHANPLERLTVNSNRLVLLMQLLRAAGSDPQLSAAVAQCPGPGADPSSDIDCGEGNVKGKQRVSCAPHNPPFLTETGAVKQDNHF